MYPPLEDTPLFKSGEDVMSEVNISSEEVADGYRKVARYFYDLLGNQESFVGYTRPYRYFSGDPHTILVSTSEYWALDRGVFGEIKPDNPLTIVYLDPKIQRQDVEKRPQRSILIPDFVREVLTFDGMDPHIVIHTKGIKTVELTSGGIAQVKILTGGPATDQMAITLFTTDPQEATKILVGIKRVIEGLITSG